MTFILSSLDLNQIEELKQIKQIFMFSSLLFIIKHINCIELNKLVTFLNHLILNFI